MRFGIFYEHQLPQPWGPDDEHRLLKDALVQVVLADQLGIDYLWLVEHHLPEREGTSPTLSGARQARGSRCQAGRPAPPAPARPSEGGARRLAPKAAGAGARRRFRIAWWSVVCAVTGG